jgi:ATP-dependent Lhr-like helicase
LKALAHDVQRNLLAPIAEMGLDLRVETRSGDTPSERKARQRARPPHVLLTTPESLSLLLSYPEAPEIFSGLKRVVIDEIHAFATGKRGDLLALALARLQALAPGLQRVGLSATVAHEDGFRSWLAPGARWIPSRWSRGRRARRRRWRSWFRRASGCRGAAMRRHGRCRN